MSERCHSRFLGTYFLYFLGRLGRYQTAAVRRHHSILFSHLWDWSSLLLVSYDFPPWRLLERPPGGKSLIPTKTCMGLQKRDAPPIPITSSIFFFNLLLFISSAGLWVLFGLYMERLAHGPSDWEYSGKAHQMDGLMIKGRPSTVLGPYVSEKNRRPFSV